DAGVADELAQDAAQGGGHGVAVARGQRAVDACDQPVAPLEGDVRQRAGSGVGDAVHGRSVLRPPVLPPSRRSKPPGQGASPARKPPTAGEKRAKSTRKASWPWGDSSGSSRASAPPARRPSAISSCCCSGNRMSVCTPIASARSTRIF